MANLATLDCGLDQIPTALVRETTNNSVERGHTKHQLGCARDQQWKKDEKDGQVNEMHAITNTLSLNRTQSLYEYSRTKIGNGRRPQLFGKM
jgi:hypothetical protein